MSPMEVLSEIERIRSDKDFRKQVKKEADSRLREVDKDRIWSEMCSLLNLREYSNRTPVLLLISKDDKLDVEYGGSLSFENSGEHFVKVSPYGFLVNKKITSDNPWIDLLSYQYSFFLVNDLISRPYGKKKTNMYFSGNDMPVMQGIIKGMMYRVEEVSVDRLSVDSGKEVTAKRIETSRKHSQAFERPTNMLDYAERVWKSFREKDLGDTLKAAGNFEYLVKSGWPTDVAGYA